MCDRAKPLSDFLFDELSAKTDTASEEGKVRLFTLVEPYLKQMAKAPLLARSLRQRLAALSGVATTERRVQPVVRKPVGGINRPASPTAHRIVLQALLHRPERLKTLPELPDSESPAFRQLEAILAVMREHPELADVRGLLEYFRGQPEEGLVQAAAAGLLEWGEDYESESDLRGAWATLMGQAAQQQMSGFKGKKLSDISPEERARYMTALKEKKLDQLSQVKSEE
jgi:DNA primase